MSDAELDALIEGLERFLRERFGGDIEPELPILRSADATGKRAAFLVALAREPAMRSFVANPVTFGLPPAPVEKQRTWFSRLGEITERFMDEECCDHAAYVAEARSEYVRA